MILYLFDDTPSLPGEKHRDIDFEYQIEQWLLDIAVDHTSVVRIVCPELGREWKRDKSGAFAVVASEPAPPDPAELLELLKQTIDVVLPSESCYTGPVSKGQMAMVCGSCGWEGPRMHTRGLGWCPKCRAPTEAKMLPGETAEQYEQRVYGPARGTA